MKASKNAIQHAQKHMRDTLETALAGWDISHPKKAREIGLQKLISTAFADAEYQQWVVRTLNDGRSAYVSLTDYERHSPKVKALCAAEADKDAARNKQRDEIAERYSKEADAIINAAAIGEWSGECLLEAVNGFIAKLEKEVK